MSLDTLLEAAKYLETIEQNGDGFRSGSSCSGSMSSSGDRSPGGYLRLDPNLPISSQFHDYFCNPLVTGASFESKFKSNNKSHKSGARSSTGRTGSGSSSGGSRSRKQTPILISPGKKYTTSESLSEGESAFSGSYDNSAGTASAESVFHQHIGTSAGSSFGRGGGGVMRGPRTGEPESSIRHRELHKTLEKNRRAHLRHCFEELRKELPKSEYSYKKSSHINIIHSAIRYINALKKTEWEHEHELERLARSKIRNQNYLAQIRQEQGKTCSGRDMAFKSAAASGSATSSASSSKSSSPPTNASSAAMSPVGAAECRLSPSSASCPFSWPRAAAVVPGLE